MTELSPDARSLLDAGRHAHDPPPAARHRVRARVLAEVAAPAPRRTPLRPLALVAVAVVVALLAALALRRTPAPMTPVSPVTPAPTLAPPQRTVPAPAPAPSVSPAITAAPAPAPAPVVAPPQRNAHPAEPADTLAAELRLLRDARAQLAAANAPGALATLDQHARRFPHGQLTEEREAVRALARCAAHPDAAEADRFARAWPASPSIPRVRRACTDAP